MSVVLMISSSGVSPRLVHRQPSHRLLAYPRRSILFVYQSTFSADAVSAGARTRSCSVPQGEQRRRLQPCGRQPGVLGRRHRAARARCALRRAGRRETRPVPSSRCCVGFMLVVTLFFDRRRGHGSQRSALACYAYRRPDRVTTGDALFALLITAFAIESAGGWWPERAQPERRVLASLAVTLMTTPASFARRWPVAVSAVLAAGVAVNWVAIGHLVRCGAGLVAVFYTASGWSASAASYGPQPSRSHCCRPTWSVRRTPIHDSAQASSSTWFRFAVAFAGIGCSSQAATRWSTNLRTSTAERSCSARRTLAEASSRRPRPDPS